MTMRGLVFIVVSWIAVASSEAVAATTPSTRVIGPAESIAEKPARAASGEGSDGARYAERERGAKELEKFRGGEGVSIYIGGSVVAVALVVVIALLIL